MLRSERLKLTLAAVGNIIGPQFFISSQSPTYPLGIGAMLVAFALMAVAGVLYWILCVVENKSKDHTHSLVQDVASARLQADGDDVTDGENHIIRYSY
jgi:hypothetical protein